MKKFRLAVFASGNGSNAEEIFSFFQRHPAIEVALVLTNNSNAGVLERAEKYSIPTHVFTREQFAKGTEVVDLQRIRESTHKALAGFLLLISKVLTDGYPHRIINIHPALLPKFGGKGMYGMRVHEAVKAANEKVTGITIHEVNEKYDEGKVLFQTLCSIDAHESIEQINRKVLALEHAHYPRVIAEWITSAKA
ncbi:MAG: phosphoribosylglycinamide formyltransferase [Flammeovirgaceae bacterium]|nr:phosphoribosylglycinamide formyltransferase [Flammeovirgaceae bacterium]